MVLLDAYPLVALLADEPAAAEVGDLLRGGEAGITAVNLAEAADVLHRRVGVPLEEVVLLVEPLVAKELEVLDVSLDHAWRAAAIRGEFYRRRTCELSLADCVLLAAAGVEHEVATADPAVADVARALETRLRPLPDSRGRRPY